ncbi:hypothetical protein ncot_12150 [Nocardioides sp. JQ2195]|uniref:hypothetical protein n=1 Tax=Nocardioides sp. JQ2195 TaxID=2592334 RepID=UPI00143EDB6C|nr:hypothetical protein [Nocardioides sp. JQ2195]QIX27267.1 hypothetical protein ncot_12150 [Nocardioides sp. JQ2195]
MKSVMQGPEWDRSEELADRIGLPIDVWDELFGRGWRLNDSEPWHDYDSDPSGGEGHPVTPWHLKGDPPQLMLRVFHHGIFIARPAGLRRDDGRVEFHESAQEYVAFEQLAHQGPEIVKWMLTSRRRQFRWCPQCWTHTPPEEWAADRCVRCHRSVG